VADPGEIDEYRLTERIVDDCDPTDRNLERLDEHDFSGTNDHRDGAGTDSTRQWARIRAPS